MNLLKHPHPDIHLNFEQLVRQEDDLNFEEHFVTSDDGFINKVFRINKGNQYDNSKYINKSRPAVLMIHGLLDSSDTWIVNGRKESPGFILADAGYDVWLANTRGNKHSSNHTTLDIETSKKYWERSNSIEMAKHDIPSFIAYVKE